MTMFLIQKNRARDIFRKMCLPFAEATETGVSTLLDNDPKQSYFNGNQESIFSSVIIPI